MFLVDDDDGKHDYCAFVSNTAMNVWGSEFNILLNGLVMGALRQVYKDGEYRGNIELIITIQSDISASYHLLKSKQTQLYKFPINTSSKDIETSHHHHTTTTPINN